MGTTGGKRFIFPTWRGDFQNGENNFNIAENDSQDRKNAKDDTSTIYYYVTAECVSTSKIKDFRRVTEEICNFHIFEASDL